MRCILVLGLSLILGAAGCGTGVQSSPEVKSYLAKVTAWQIQAVQLQKERSSSLDKIAQNPAIINSNVFKKELQANLDASEALERVAQSTPAPAGCEQIKTDALAMAKQGWFSAVLLVSDTTRGDNQWLPAAVGTNGKSADEAKLVLQDCDRLAGSLSAK
jgi:hypothetical protein